MATKAPNESQTRSSMIDTQLARAGWSANRRDLLEESVIGTKESSKPYDSKQIADYILLSSVGEPLAVVEAKKTTRDAIAGKRQAADYADLIKRDFGYDPFIFLANGKEILFWGRASYPPRSISGYYTRDDLERLLHQRKYSQPLGNVDINERRRTNISELISETRYLSRSGIPIDEDEIDRILDAKIAFKEEQIGVSSRMIIDVAVLKYQREHQLAELLAECA